MLLYPLIEFLKFFQLYFCHFEMLCFFSNLLVHLHSFLFLIYILTPSFISLKVLNLFKKSVVFLIQHVHHSGPDSLLIVFAALHLTMLYMFDVLLLLTVRSYFGELDLREFFEVMVETVYSKEICIYFC